MYFNHLPLSIILNVRYKSLKSIDISNEIGSEITIFHAYLNFGSGDEFIGNSTSILSYSGITVKYWRYASNYGFVFLGTAVVLISSYVYRRYRWSKN